MGPLARRIVVVTTLSASLLVAVPTAAHAATVVTLDTTTTGHVRGSGTTDAAFISISLVDGAQVRRTSAPQQVIGGAFTFDEETWGLRTDRTYTLRVNACANAGIGSCVPTDTAFTPTDVDPEVTWPVDRAIGPGETASVTIADPLGGGFLMARWGEEASSLRVLVAGVNTLALKEGAGTVSIQRCGYGIGCRETGLSAGFVVDQVFQGYLSGGGRVRPDGTPAADATFEVGGEAPEPVTFVWHVVDASEATVPGSDGTVTGIVLGAFATIPIGVDLTGLPDGPYRLVGEMSYDSTDFGHRSHPFRSSPVWVDTVGPDTMSNLGVSNRRVFPAPDGYRDEFRILFRTPEEGGSGYFEYLRKDGTPVARVDVEVPGPGHDRWVSTVWRGRNDNKGMVRAGTYRVRFHQTDSVGNTGRFDLGKVTVSWKRFVSARVDRSVTASASMLDSWSGGCSSILRGGSRHQRGALGLMSNTRCGSRTWEGSGVSSVHGIRVPPGWVKGNVSVSVIGGAARGRQGSIAVLEYWSKKESTWVAANSLDGRYGEHADGWTVSTNLIVKDALIWRVATGYGNRYDVKAFKVSFRGKYFR